MTGLGSAARIHVSARGSEDVGARTISEGVYRLDVCLVKVPVVGKQALCIVHALI